MTASSTKRKEVTETPSEASNPPLNRFTDGDVSAAVFGNEREVKGTLRTFYNVSVSRSYEKGGRYQRSHSFGRTDLPKLARVLKEAEAFIDSLQPQAE